MIDIDLMLGLLVKQDRENLITAIQELALFDDLIEEYTHNDDVRSIEAERDEALDELQNAKAERDEELERHEHNLTLSHPLHEAICEGRKDDAIYLLREMFDQHFNDADTYARLFPGRVK